MAVVIETHAPTHLAQADIKPRGPVHPSPVDWRDQVLYFLLPDRFSDGKEAARPMFDQANPGAHAAASRAAWMDAGKRFQGGTIKGIQSKLPYLAGLGVTTLWIGPVWKQRHGFDDYHGYGIQNFLEIDPRFGTRQDLRDLVDAAHGQGMRVLLDIIYNHSGNNWYYRRHDGIPVDKLPYRYAPAYDVHGWRAQNGSSMPAPGSIEDGVWPAEFQNHDWYTRAGAIGHWDPQPWENRNHPANEFRRGDFGDYKDMRLSELEYPSQDVLSALIRVYCYWIALSDRDGFRIDTCKHMQVEASRNFCGAVREYAEFIGKENFLLLGEVAGGAEMEHDYIAIFGRNLDAALDLGDPPKILAAMAKGLPAVHCADGNSVAEFFAQFGGHDLIGSHREVGRYHVSVLDDHDMIGRTKRRFAPGSGLAAGHVQTAHAVGVQLTTLGIPCIYYGTEQAFDGGEQYHDTAVEPKNGDGKIPYDDRYVREAMFGGTFGAFATGGCHFFDTAHPTYLRIAAIARLLRPPSPHAMVLRRGRQYPREVRILGQFGPSKPGEIVAWSRVQHDREVLVALNSNGAAARGADVTVDSRIHPPGSAMTVLYRGDWTDQQLRQPPTNQAVTVQADGGRAFVRVDLPPAGMLIVA